MTWTAENYGAKAQAYWERATSRGRDSEDFLLNVSFVVEFIARGAVCRVSPALNAAQDQESLFFACGQVPRAPAKTADLFEVLKRLQRMLPTLTEAEITSIHALIGARNGELHGDTASLAELDAETLMPSIYSFLVKASEFAALQLDSILGPDDSRLAKQTTEAIAKDRTKRVKDLVQVCKDRFFSLTATEQAAKRKASETAVVSAVLTSGHHIKYLKCPACSQSGQLLASPVGHSAPFLRGGGLVKEVRIVPLQFHCKCCGLEIRGLDELMAGGFRHEYRSLDEVDPMEHFNINPLDYIDPEAVAREYYGEPDEYQDE